MSILKLYHPLTPVFEYEPSYVSTAPWGFVYPYPARIKPLCMREKAYINMQVHIYAHSEALLDFYTLDFAKLFIKNLVYQIKNIPLQGESE